MNARLGGGPARGPSGRAGRLHARRQTRRALIISGLCALLAGAATCSSKDKKGGKPAARPAGHSATLFFTTEMNGQLEPCGCNSDPMGDIARTTALIEGARAKGPVLVLDGGSLLYEDARIPEAERAQADLKAKALLAITQGGLGVDAFGLGPNDLALGPASVSPPRHAVNLSQESKVPLAPPQVFTVGEVKVGVFGVVAPQAIAGAGLEASDPTAAAAGAVAQLREGGAQAIVALAHMQRRDAVALARAVDGIDFLLVAQKAPSDPLRIDDAPQKIGETYLFQPANRGQVVSRVDLTIRTAKDAASSGGKGGDQPARFTDALGPARLPALTERLEALKSDVAKWRQDPTAEPGFLAQKERELAELSREHKALTAEPVRVPAQGNWFTFEQVRIRKQLACDAEAQAKKAALDVAIAEVNLTASRARGPAKPPAEGKPGFSGIEECGFCHQAAVTFWQGTRHAGAWETLVKDNKQASLDCVGCHVTGWDQPGGATLAFNDGLQDVQCEVCHGPGSLHVDKNGKDSPRTVVRTPPEDVCLRCHNEEHSDTFDYTAYLRDITGKGHGEAFRQTLGDGPTGHELRRAALERAGLSIGEGCKK